MSDYIYTTMHPAIYHGHSVTPPYFEGWYYKLISADERERFAIIPGVILGEEEHAFIQVLNGADGSSAYHTFPIETFHASRRDFDIHIGNNRFTANHLSLNIDDDQGSLHGELDFSSQTPWPVTWRSPGIMGWYAWIPWMECYHGVLSFDHDITGQLFTGNRKLDFSGGRGYIEKDWGRSFPSAWIWFQSNHFETIGTSITTSIANIPFMGTSFRGFIVGLWHEGKLYRFATYTGAELTNLVIQEDHVSLTLSDQHHRLDLTATTGTSGLILGPTRNDMGLHVNETLQATVDVRLSTRKGKELFAGRGRHAGLEVQGALDQLL